MRHLHDHSRNSPSQSLEPVAPLLDLPPTPSPPRALPRRWTAGHERSWRHRRGAERERRRRRNPAATSPSIVGISEASKTMSGSMFSSAQSSLVSCRRPNWSPSATNCSSAAAAAAPWSGWPAGARAERPGRVVRHTAGAKQNQGPSGRGEVMAMSAWPHRTRSVISCAGPWNRSNPHRGHRIPEPSELFRVHTSSPANEGRPAVPGRYPDRAVRRCVRWRNAFRPGPSCVLEHDLAVGVQSEPTIDPVEQWCTGLVFEARQCARQCRLADP